MALDTNAPLDVKNPDIAGAYHAGVQAKQQESINNLIIDKRKQEIKQQDAMDEIRRTATYARDTVLPMLQSGDTEQLKTNLEQRIQTLNAQGRDSTGSQKALALLQAGKFDDLRKVSENVVQVARDNKLLPETYTNVTNDKGEIIAQRSTVSGKEIASPRAGKPGTKKRVNAQLPNGNIVPAIQDENGYLLDPATGNRMPNALLAPSRQLTAQAKNFKTKQQLSKEAAAGQDAEISLRQNLHDLQNLKELVASPDYVGGATGQVFSLINSAAAQVRQATGSEPVVKGNNIDPNVFSKDIKDETLSRFRKAAITKDRFDSAVLELAYLKAKALNPDGRISDADVRTAEDILGKGASKQSRIQVMNDLMQRIVDHYNIEQGVVARNNQTDFTPLTVSGVLGGQVNQKTDTKQTPSDLADSILQKEGFNSGAH